MIDIQNIVVSYPLPAVIIIATLITLITTLITKYMIDQNRMKELREIQKACQIKIKDHKDDPAKMAEINKQMMECSMELMKHSFKPLLITMIPLFILLAWMKGVFETTTIAKAWFWWYIGAGIASSIIFRKMLRVV
jgi:uncharacterized membrane protein (DUF106 family)